MRRIEELHLDRATLEAGLEGIRQSPADAGALELIVRRPAPGAREVLAQAELTVAEGLAGDGWRARELAKSGSANSDKQLTLMNARAIALIAVERPRWALAGDQLFVDLDLSEANLPPGSRLAVGTAVIEVTAPPHTGCKKFVERFGLDAMLFVNSPLGRQLRLRGLNARVIVEGTIRSGDRISRAAAQR